MTNELLLLSLSPCLSAFLSFTISFQNHERNPGLEFLQEKKRHFCTKVEIVKLSVYVCLYVVVGKFYSSGEKLDDSFFSLHAPADLLASIHFCGFIAYVQYVLI